MNWWHSRRKHIFPAYRGCGYSGLNLSEPGNSAWKTRKPLRLVDACLEDCATQVRQEEDLNLFYSHEGPAMGKAPDTATTTAKEKRDQVKRAQAYAEIIHDKGALLKQADEMANPSVFIPASAAKHRPPRKGKYNIQGKEYFKGKPVTKKAPRKTRGKAKPKCAASSASAQGEVEDTVSSLPTEPHHIIKISVPPSRTTPAVHTVRTEGVPIAPKVPLIAAHSQVQGYFLVNPLQGGTKKAGAHQLQHIAPKPRATMQSHLSSARAILGEPVTNFVEILSHRVHKLPGNPPLLMAIGNLNISRCMGCPTPIASAELRPPHNLVFKTKGMRSFIHPQSKTKITYEGNCYFHLKLSCLRCKFPTTEERDFHCTDDEFMKLTGEHMMLLKDKGILPYIMANKM